MTRRRLLLATGLLGLVACAGSPPTRLHLLAVEPEAAIALPARPAPLLVGVGPIDVADYLERPEIVTRRTRTELQLAELDRWAERFEVMLARTLRESLARLLATDGIVEMPTDRELVPDYRVEASVLRFDAEPTGAVVLEARWLLTARGQSRPLRLERSELRLPIEGEGPPAVVATMSRTFGDLAGLIAEAIGRAEWARVGRPARPAGR